ncbi:TrkH family potassium uptake protein [Geoalkalibacter subterraneus]|uniref:Potassium transporter n=1 Tax=Geoalkalibacter subterraneus TaxID=483547 RepID=A0A0B5FDV4_9BACT|nr:TrkH family potassium uptake protein [Geoalkalibacter subterraneus]AJF05473.1 potassium transporter [Geoalkalibacter subterraneus]
MKSLSSYKIKNPSPAQSLIIYYALAIFLGTLLLSTPLATQGPRLSFLDALFTATSAQCVTGLIVVDTGTRLSMFGQGVVLALIQIGGLGIMTFSVYLFIYLRVGVSLRGRRLIQDTLLHTPINSWRQLIKGVIFLTLIIEGVGAALLCAVFVPEQGWLDGTWCALFHSISAFCNAGFSLFSDSLVGYRANPLVNLTVMTLIILGGIGFLVIHEVLEFALGRRKKNARMSLHTRLVLITTFFLIIYGTAMIGFLEFDNALAGLPFMEGLWTSFFQSITARTAGFNTIDLNAFAAPTLFLLMFLMFIGASPGSAGGGVKTTSLALFFCIFYSRLKHSPYTNVFKRTIPNEAVTKALALVILAIILIGIALFSLLIAQETTAPMESAGKEFLSLSFETVSAFATVGLSMGATGELTAPGKMIVIALMFVGRVGLLTVAFAIAGTTRRHAPRYSEENVMVG